MDCTICKPWIVPFVTCISFFKQDLIGDLLALLPKEIIIFGEKYVLAGYSMFGGGHFTCIINDTIKDKQFYYDGIAPTNERTISSDDFKEKEGSFAFQVIYYCTCNNNALVLLHQLI